MILIDRIRRLLVQPNGLTVEALQPLAEEYGIETEKANARLSDCMQLLRKGLRAEALQLADIKPRLIETSAILDFPELDEWIEILKFYGIPVPTVLDRDAALQLQEASIDEQPLDDLLRQHRRLAIAKAPLSWRLRVIRRLAKLDLKNPVWRDDQRDWEVIRLKQIPAELTSAVETQDLNQVEELRSELVSSDWIEKPPKELIQRAVGSHRDFRYQHQVAHLTTIADRMHMAFSEGNEAICEGAYSDWNRQIAELVDPAPLALVTSIEPAIEWLQERIKTRKNMDEHTRLCSDLEMMVKGNANIAELEQQYLDIIALQLGIPELLEQRYETKLAELRQSQKRKTQFAYFGAVSFVVVLLSVFAIWQWRKGVAESIANATQRLEELIRNEDYSAADQFVTQLTKETPEISRSSPILGLVADLNSKISQERARVDRVADLIAQANNDDPSRINIGKLKQAEQEAKTVDEKFQIASIRSAFESHSDDARKSDYESIKNAVERLEVMLTEIQSRRLSDIKESDLDTLLVDAKKLTNDFPRGATDAAQLIAFFSQKVNSFKASYQEKKAELGLRQSIVNALWNARTNVAFEAAVEKYINQLPNDGLAQEFADTRLEQELWRSVEELNQGWIRLRGIVNNIHSSKELGEAIQILESLDKKLVLGNTPKSLISELRQEREAIDLRQAALEELQKHFVEDSVFRDVATLILPGGKLGRRRFIPTAAKLELDSKQTSDNTKTMVTVVIGQDAETSEEEFRGRLKVIAEPRVTVQNLVRMIRNDNAKIVESWDRSFLDLFDMIVKQPELDHRIKELLLYQLIKAFRRASPTINQSYEPFEKLLFERANSKPWYLLGENNSELEPVVLKRLQESQQAFQAIMSRRRNALLSFSSKSISWVGALVRDSNDRIVPMIPNESIADGSLYTVVPTNDDPGVGRIAEIGRVHDGKVELIDNLPELAPGRPLYALTILQGKGKTP